MNMWKYFERQKNSQKEIGLAIYGGVELTGEKKSPEEMKTMQKILLETRWNPVEFNYSTGAFAKLLRSQKLLIRH